MLEWAIAEILYSLGKKGKNYFFKYSHDGGAKNPIPIMKEKVQL